MPVGMLSMLSPARACHSYRGACQGSYCIHNHPCPRCSCVKAGPAQKQQTRWRRAAAPQAALSELPGHPLGLKGHKPPVQSRGMGPCAM